MNGSTRGRTLSVCTLSFAVPPPQTDAQWASAVEGCSWTAVTAGVHEVPEAMATVVLDGWSGTGPVPANPAIPVVGPVLGVFRRLLAANRVSRRAARAVRGSKDAVRALESADVIVCLDPVGERVAWTHARRNGSSAYAGAPAGARAISSLLAARAR
ncbi:hypothetical protein [Cellulosimicrobium sp. NPDC057127]|uniref:hypothetical protein n=1 Tax=Cellulosimicrobium sp. NPDC057127 TaxID=3346026 RepID=UPI00362EFB58